MTTTNTAAALTIETMLALPANDDAPTGAVIVVKGHGVKSENGSFRLVSAHEGLAHKVANGCKPAMYWKRINTRTGGWAAGGNTSHNLKGHNLDKVNEMIAAGIVSITA